MAFIKKYSIDAPNDPEVIVKVRESLEYYMVFPTGYNEKEKYGLVFCISGYGQTADSEYYSDKLCPYISDKYNIISVGVRYHNDERTKPNLSVNIPAICNFYNINQDYFNVGNKTIIDRLFDLIIDRGIFSLDARLALSTEAYHKYSSFGFMPAIDHLSVLSEILNNFNIDRRNIMAFGTSYGGYVASLMAKYAPQTFSLVIDNSGFCLSQLQEILGGKFGGATGSIPRYLNGRRYEIPINASTLWSTDETSDLYFSDAHKQIRNLLIEEHRVKSNTMYCCYHSVKDDLVPISLKDKMYEILSKYNSTYYKRVEEKDIDGKLFKTSEHGMNASLRKMFDYSMVKYRENGHEANELTDFDLGLTNCFVCLDKQYNFSFSDRGLYVSIDKLKRDSSLPNIESKDIVVNLEEVLPEKSKRTISNNLEVIKNILDLIPTMKEGLEYLLQNSNNGNLKDGINVAEDFKYCISSIENSIYSDVMELPENQIESKTNRIRESLDMLFSEYKMNNRENAIKTIETYLIPSFDVWEEELTRVLQPII